MKYTVLCDISVPVNMQAVSLVYESKVFDNKEKVVAVCKEFTDED